MIFPLIEDLTDTYRDITPNIVNMFSDGTDIDFYFRLKDSKPFEVIVTTADEIINDNYNGRGLLVDQNANIFTFTFDITSKYYARATEGTNATINIRPSAVVSSSTPLTIDTNNIGTDAAGRRRVSNINTLFDGKTLNQDDPLIWDNVGTGVGGLIDNKYNMSVGIGEYLIRRGRHITPYFSGKSQVIENTFDNMASVVGVNKRVGYFSSSAVAPYNTNFDGFYLDISDGVEPTIYIWNDGTLTASIPLSSWDNVSTFSNYNFDNFTVLQWDFLWLGGTDLRMFIKINGGFILAHTYVHASTKQGTFIKSPNHSVRYDIEGVSDIGNINAICSTVGTEGEFPGAGKPISIYNETTVSPSVVNTIYALKGVKKTTANRDLSIVVTGASLLNIKKDDPGMFYILLNPTLSLPLSYVPNSHFQDGTGDMTQTISLANVGRVLRAIPAGITGTVSGVNDSILSNIGMDINNVSDEIVLAYQPATVGQELKGILTLKEY